MKILTTASMLLLAAGCSAQIETPAQSKQITGVWRIEDVDETGFIDLSRLEITFTKDGKVNGHSGCNSFMGEYTRDGDSIEIGPLAATEKACAPALMNQEARIFATLDAVDTVTWSKADGALMLTGPEPASLTLRGMDAGEPVEEPEDAATTPAEFIGPVVFGQVSYVEKIALPEDAVLRVTASDISRMDVVAPTLALYEGPAADGPPFSFSLEIPAETLEPNTKIGVRAVILQGPALLFTSTQSLDVPHEGVKEPLLIQLNSTNAGDFGTGAGGAEITPVPATYICGDESLEIALETGMAYVTLEDGNLLELPRSNPEDVDPEATRRYSDGRITLQQEFEGMNAGISLARGKAAFTPCDLEE